MTTPQGGIALTAVAASGNLTQLYNASCTAGTAIASANHGDTLRKPAGGHLLSAQVQTDGTNGGTIEIYDINGLEAGADVSAGTAITNSQLATALAAGRARLIWSQDFSADAGARTASARIMPFLHGLAARYVNVVEGTPTGACWLNIVADGLGLKTTKIG